jgi:hypothetical protein
MIFFYLLCSSNGSILVPSFQVIIAAAWMISGSASLWKWVEHKTAPGIVLG